MASDNFLSVTALLISTGSLFIAVLSFRRNRRIENENYIYKLKTDHYHSFLKKIADILSKVEIGLELAKHIHKDSSEEDIDEIEKLADEIDEDVVEFSYSLASDSLVLPKRIISLLEEFSDYLMQSEIDGDSLENQNRISDICHNKADKIISEMRKDLHIDTLNILLFNRIKK